MIEGAGAQEPGEHRRFRITKFKITLQLAQHVDTAPRGQQAHTLQQVEYLVEAALAALRLAASMAGLTPFRGTWFLPSVLHVTLDARRKNADAEELDSLGRWVYEGCSQ
jgi:hypothetical protein